MFKVISEVCRPVGARRILSYLLKSKQVCVSTIHIENKKKIPTKPID